MRVLGQPQRLSSVALAAPQDNLAVARSGTPNRSVALSRGTSHVGLKWNHNSTTQPTHHDRLHARARAARALRARATRAPRAARGNFTRNSPPVTAGCIESERGAVVRRPAEGLRAAGSAESQAEPATERRLDSKTGRPTRWGSLECGPGTRDPSPEGVVRDLAAHCRTRLGFEFRYNMTREPAPRFLALRFGHLAIRRRRGSKPRPQKQEPTSISMSRLR